MLVNKQVVEVEAETKVINIQDARMEIALRDRMEITGCKTIVEFDKSEFNNWVAIMEQKSDE